MGQHRIVKPQQRFSGSQQPAAPNEFRIQYGHNATHVLMIFPTRIENLAFTEAQLDDVVKCLQETKAQLIEHKKRAGVPQQQ